MIYSKYQGYLVLGHGAVILFTLCFTQCWPSWETSWNPHFRLIFGQIKSEHISRRIVYGRGISNRKVRIAKGSFDPSSIVPTQLQLIVIEPGSLEIRLCSRSNHRIYVAWSVKGSTVAWGCTPARPTHTPEPGEVAWYRWCCLHLTASDHLISKVKRSV